MQKQKGLVFKKEDDTCLILTPDGEFKHVSLPKEVRVGEEVSLPSRITGITRVLLLAASIFAFVFSWLAYQAAFAQPAAYVSLDFNPSLELGLDKEQKIVSMIPLDHSAEKLLQDLKIKRQPFKKGINIILEKALAEGYFQTDSPQTILAAVAPAKTGAPVVITVQEVAQTINQTLEAKVEVKLIVAADTPENHRQASKTGLSSGKHLFIETAEKEGKSISVKELKEEKLNEIEAKHNVSLEKVFLKRNRIKESLIILPLPEKPESGQKPPEPAAPQGSREQENNSKTINSPGQKQPSIKQKEKRLPVPGQEQAIPDNKAKQSDNREVEWGSARNQFGRRIPNPDKPEPKRI